MTAVSLAGRKLLENVVRQVVYSRYNNIIRENVKWYIERFASIIQWPMQHEYYNLCQGPNSIPIYFEKMPTICKSYISNCSLARTISADIRWRYINDKWNAASNLCSRCENKNIIQRLYFFHLAITLPTRCDSFSKFTPSIFKSLLIIPSIVHLCRSSSLLLSFAFIFITLHVQIISVYCL